MEELDGFVMEGERAVYRPVGSASFKQVIALVRAAIAAARSHKARDLLIDATALTGFQPPSKPQRYFAVEEWALEAKGTLPVAMVVPAEMIDAHKFGVVVGANRGFESNIFPTEAEARAWLDARPR